MANATSVPCLLDAYTTDSYVDATCDTPAVLTTTSCENPEIAVVGNSGPCRAYWSVSDETADVAFQNFGSCQPVDASQAVVHRAKARLEPLTLTRARQPAESRTNLIYIGDGGTRIRERELFYDATLDTECQLRQRDVDSFDCVPISLNAGTMGAFTDAACTQPIYVTLINDQASSEWPCMPRTPAKYIWDGGSEVRPVGAAYAGPLYTTSNGNGCEPYLFVGVTPYTLGPAASTPFMRVRKVFD